MKTQSVVSLDPISLTRKKQDSVVGRFLKTRHYGGKKVKATDQIGHYIFCGKQRSGKTVSMIWYAEQLQKRYEKAGYTVKISSNMGFGKEVTKFLISPLIRSIKYDSKTVYIILIDEIQAYFPKDGCDTQTKMEIDKLTADFSQLAKKNIYVLSTAQVYGRINKNLREQCLFMIDCHRTRFTNRVINDFILGDDILCDELGRWSGIPQSIKIHGLPKQSFDTHRMITE